VLFKREVPMAVLYAHVSAPPPRLTAARPELPAAMNDVLARALAKEPDDRYGSCGEFADALREALGLDPYDSASGPWPATGQTRLVTPAGPGPGARLAATAPMTVSAEASETMLSASGSAESPQAAGGTWTAVVAADRTYYDSVQAVSDSDAGSIVFPAFVPERRYPLTGTEVRIGRRSVSRHSEPEIDLTGPPRDPGVSRLHAVLVAGQDGTWSVVDPGSSNGLVVNGKDVPPGGTVPLRHGDRIHLGAWTVITITRD